MEFESFYDHGNNISSIIRSYTKNQILSKTIIRNELNNHYFVFNTKEEFSKWYTDQDIKHYHEVIIGSKIQRLKFDIDIMDTIVNVIDIKKVMTTIIDTIISTIHGLYYCIDDIVLSYKDFIVTDSSGCINEKYKHSYHIILYTYGLANYIEAKYITDNVIDNLPEDYKKYIDRSINKKLQNFRILFSSKRNSDRYKTICNKFITNSDVTLLDTLILPFVGIKVLSKLCEEENLSDNEENIDDNDDIDNETVKKIINASKTYNILDGHKIRDIKGNSINFDRMYPTHCYICNEIHHKDNSLILQYDDMTGCIYEYCRQGYKSRYICNISGTFKKQLNVDNIKKYTTKFDSLPNANIYSCNHMKDYELVDTLVVKAQMKLGKTKTLHKFVKDNFDNKSTIRFITFRQTFSNHIYSLFNDFELYSNIKGSISSHKYKRVIIQVESLYRLQFEETVIDLLILDEVESILSQLSSGLHKNFNSSFAIFLWLLKCSKHVICLDANLSDRSYNILTKFRNNDIFYHHNKWKSSQDDIYCITHDKNMWISNLLSKISNNNRVVIPTNSIMEAKTCEMIILNSFPHLKVKVYSSEMKQSEKQLYFNDVHKYWSELDILIYTPTCSAGISYEMEHFDVLFGYFTNMSCDVETCRQMINRVRNIKSKEYYIYLEELDLPKLPTNPHELHNYLFNKRSNLVNYMKDNNIQWYYDISGKIKFYETDYYYVWLENSAISNISKNNFISRFYSQVKESGATISNMQSISTIDYKDHKLVRKQIEEKKNGDICNSKELSQEDVEIIIDKMTKQLDIEQDEFLSYEKHKLRKYYKFDGPLTSTFVELYYPKHIQQIYKNLCDISACDTIDKSIERLLKIESERFMSIISTSASYKNKLEQYDLHNDKQLYTSLSHMIVSKIIVSVGTEFMKLIEYENIINIKLAPLFAEYEKYLSIELNIKFTNDIKKDINAILKKMYGLRMYKFGDEVRLKKCNKSGKLFTFNKVKTDDVITIITNNEIFLSLI